MRILLILLLLALFIPVNIRANYQISDVPLQRVNPDSYYYPLKRAREKVFYYLNFSSESKARHHLSLVPKRLAEIVYISDHKAYDEYEKSTQRYSAQIGVLADFLVKNNLTQLYKPTLEEFARDRDVLLQLVDREQRESSYWMLLYHSINSIELNRLKIDKE